jgi:5S rRNA maturation endonuclease (ribonuclease M5)
MRAGNDSAESWVSFVDLWQRLRLESTEPGTVVLVEGERDRRALRRLGLRGTVATLHAGRTLAETAHLLIRRGRRVVVLTDWDAEGGHLAHRIAEFLRAESLELDLETRRRLARVLRGELVHVEGLYGWARRLAEAEGTTLEEAFEYADGAAGSTG